MSENPWYKGKKFIKALAFTGAIASTGAEVLANSTQMQIEVNKPTPVSAEFSAPLGSSIDARINCISKVNGRLVDINITHKVGEALKSTDFSRVTPTSNKQQLAKGELDPVLKTATSDKVNVYRFREIRADGTNADKLGTFTREVSKGGEVIGDKYSWDGNPELFRECDIRVVASEAGGVLVTPANPQNAPVVTTPKPTEPGRVIVTPSNPDQAKLTDVKPSSELIKNISNFVKKAEQGKEFFKCASGTNLVTISLKGVDIATFGINYTIGKEGNNRLVFCSADGYNPLTQAMKDQDARLSIVPGADGSSWMRLQLPDAAKGIESYEVVASPAQAGININYGELKASSAGIAK
jgi:hypothetical protein